MDFDYQFTAFLNWWSLQSINYQLTDNLVTTPVLMNCDCPGLKWVLLCGVALDECVWREWSKEGKESCWWRHRWKCLHCWSRKTKSWPAHCRQSKLLAVVKVHCAPKIHLLFIFWITLPRIINRFHWFLVREIPRKFDIKSL